MPRQQVAGEKQQRAAHAQHAWKAILKIAMAEKKPVVETVKTDVQNLRRSTPGGKGPGGAEGVHGAGSGSSGQHVHAMARWRPGQTLGTGSAWRWEETAAAYMRRLGVIKNMFATEYIWHDIKKKGTVGVLEEKRWRVMWKWPSPWA